MLNNSLVDEYNIPFFKSLIQNSEYHYTKNNPEIMQINLGKLCNLSCKHCHVEAGPSRTEVMSKSIMETCLKVFQNYNFKTLDITGGSPEMNPNFKWLITEAKKMANKIIVRTNLVILEEPEYEHLIDFYASNKLEIVCSLPYYTSSDTDRQRGMGVFNSSITVLQRLNKIGYGRTNDLVLNLVYNPGGAFLPPSQLEMEHIYKKELKNKYNIDFTSLFTITNNPIGRFKEFLVKTNNIEMYMKKLYDSFNEDTIENMMCRNQLSVSWNGRLFDCDFNQAINLCGNNFKHISDLVNTKNIHREIAFAQHCYACTAGLGSSCGGVTIS